MKAKRTVILSSGKELQVKQESKGLCLTKSKDFRWQVVHRESGKRFAAALLDPDHDRECRIVYSNARKLFALLLSSIEDTSNMTESEVLEAVTPYVYI